MILRSLFIIFFISCIYANTATSQDPEISVLDNLIEVTQKNLNNQKLLHQKLIHFKEVQKKYIEDTDNKKLAEDMIYSANEVLQVIESSHLMHLFNVDFMKDIEFFAQFSGNDISNY